MSDEQEEAWWEQEAAKEEAAVERERRQANWLHRLDVRFYDLRWSTTASSAIGYYTSALTAENPTES